MTYDFVTTLRKRNSDEWEYRRLVELVVLVLPELKQEVLKLGAQSENEEMREVVEDFQNL